MNGLMHSQGDRAKDLGSSALMAGLGHGSPLVMVVDLVPHGRHERWAMAAREAKVQKKKKKTVKFFMLLL